MLSVLLYYWLFTLLHHFIKFYSLQIFILLLTNDIWANSLFCSLSTNTPPPPLPYFLLMKIRRGGKMLRKGPPG